MKTHAITKLRRTFADDKTALGLWVTLESPSITEMAVVLGLDFVVIDAEHGHLDWKEIVEHLRATARSETVLDSAGGLDKELESLFDNRSAPRTGMKRG